MTKFKMKAVPLLWSWIMLYYALCLLPSSSGLSELSFVTEPCDVTVQPKSAALLDCAAHGHPPISIRWLKDGVLLTEEEQNQHRVFLANGSLYLPSVRPGPFSNQGPEGSEGPSDQGFYQCLSQNRYGAILSQRSQLTITSASEFVEHPVAVVTTEGSLARFSCTLMTSSAHTQQPMTSSARTQAITITWERDRTALPLHTDRITVLPNGVLQISNVQSSDSGRYRCVASSILIGSVTSDDAALTVTTGSEVSPPQSPRILFAPQNVTVPLGQAVVLECVASGAPRPVVSWSRADGRPIDADARVVGRGNLLIPYAKARHAGAYVCRATTPGTRNTSIMAAANITVMVPPSIVERPESQTRPRAGTARFLCRAEGVPPPRITWLKNAQEVTLNGRIQMYNSKLVITQIIPEDEAIYQCVAQSAAGSTLAAPARLVVVMSEDRPGAPRNVHAETISSSAILLAWSRPSYNAERVIAYSVHYMKAEGVNNEEYQAVMGNDTTSHIVDDLQSDQSYSFYIVAYMPMGASRMSPQVTQRTLEDVPLRTPELSLSSSGPTDIQVSWRPLPAKLSRGRVRTYRLAWRSAAATAAGEEEPGVDKLNPPGGEGGVATASVQTVELTDNVTHYALEGLQPDTIYLLRLAAATRVGWCEPGAWTSHRTPRLHSAKVLSAPVLQLDPVNCTAIVAHWHSASLPGNGTTGGPSLLVRGFRLSYHEVNQPERPSITLTASHTQLSITGLDPRRKYQVKVLAFSDAGDGYHADQTVSTPGCVSTRDHPVAAPPPPDHVTAVGTNHSSPSVLLSWRRPDYPNNRPVSYTVRCTPVGPHSNTTVRYVTIANQSVLLQGLDQNSIYELVVRLQLDQRSSPWSSVVLHHTPPRAPSRPPAGLKVVLIEEDTALASWRVPDEINVLVTRYTVRYANRYASMDGRWKVLHVEGSNSMALLEHLTAGETYMVKVSASNQLGDGPSSLAVELAPPPAPPQHRGGSHRKNRNSYQAPDHNPIQDTPDGLYHIDQRSVTGIIVGVVIALACIVMCALILISKSRSGKSFNPKAGGMGAMGGTGARPPARGPPRPTEQRLDNAEVLVPMMSSQLFNHDKDEVVSVSGSASQRWTLFNRDKHLPNNDHDVENRACLYEAGKTVLCFDERLATTASRELYGPTLRRDASQSGGEETSGETGDSGHYSNNEEDSDDRRRSPSGPGREDRLSDTALVLQPRCLAMDTTDPLDLSNPAQYPSPLQPLY